MGARKNVDGCEIQSKASRPSGSSFVHRYVRNGREEVEGTRFSNTILLVRELDFSVHPWCSVNA